jgi:hypothetical protein
MPSDARHQVNLSIANGHWPACFAASMMDGHAADRWRGEVTE